MYKHVLKKQSQNREGEVSQQHGGSGRYRQLRKVMRTWFIYLELDSRPAWDE